MKNSDGKMHWKTFISEKYGNEYLVPLPILRRGGAEQTVSGSGYLIFSERHKTAERQAAEAIGAETVVPECPPGTDFNDMARVRSARATEILTGKLPRLAVSEIMATDYKPIKWAVEGIIPEGLTILAGRPKFGISWMMLGLGYAVATGTAAWNFGNTCKGTVYYLALEDSPRRIKNRIEAMEGYFDTYPKNFFILTNVIRENEYY